jgi:hypothetical protein
VSNGALALLFAHLLPGLLASKLLGLGRSLEERLVIALVLGGPIAALLFLLVLLTGAEAVFWIATALCAVLALLVRRKARLPRSWSLASMAWLGSVLVLVLVPYFLTTGSLYRVDPSGELILDRALQRDALFHLGIIRSLETSYPPRLLSVGGEPIGYHSGFHLQLALWARLFGIASEDGLIRLAPGLQIALYVLSAYLLARRLFQDEAARRLSTILVLASGFGFLFFFRPSLDWWSLAFMDWALVSIFLPNPLLAALPLLFVGLALLHDYQQSGAPGALAGGVFAIAFLFAVKMFLGAQVIAALFLATLASRFDRRALTSFGASVLGSSPLVLATLFAAAGSNTAIGLRPLEIVRYSMEKLSWKPAIEALAQVGALAPSGEALLLAAAATLLWLAGFLGLRALGLPLVIRDLSSRCFLSSAIAWFAAIGFPLSLLLRIAPAEAEGLSRLEAVNDAAWFVAASGIALWFPAARALARAPLPIGLLAAAALALPSTAQHFVHAASLGVDRIGADEVEGSREAERVSSPSSIWVEPPDRSHPSLLAYFAGRPTVHDPYVGYDYMFFGREAIDYRRHAIAQFWASDDPAYLAWFLDRFRVEYVWLSRPLHPSSRDFLVPLAGNPELSLARVDETAVQKLLVLPLSTPESIPLGGRGQPFFGGGWQRNDRRETREIAPHESARLYLPLEGPIVLDFTLESPSESGALSVDAAGPIRSEGASLRFAVKRKENRGLQAIDVAWRGSAPLVVREIRAAVLP